MAPLAIGFGIVLALLGPALYLLSEPEKQSMTAFIPSYFGMALIVLGLVGRNEKFRMHAMHGAAVVGLLGVVLPLGRLVFSMAQANFQFGLAAAGTLAMSALCGIFLGLCVKSFIDVRAARKQREAAAQPK